MNGRGIGRFVALVVLAGALIPLAGCTYWTHRAQDATDVLELGVTESDESQFAIYAGVTHLFMVGQTDLDCKLHGIANSQWGTHNVYDDSWGWGFLGEDTHEVASGGATVATTGLPIYDTGILAIFGRTAQLRRALNSPLMLHFGWVGVHVNVKGAELIDLLVGLTTLDVLDDDTGERPLGGPFE